MMQHWLLQMASRRSCINLKCKVKIRMMLQIVASVFVLKCLDVCIAAGIDRLGDNFSINKQGVD
jgi:hypothetical protein